MDTPPRFKDGENAKRTPKRNSQDVKGSITWDHDTPYRKTVGPSKLKLQQAKKIEELNQREKEIKNKNIKVKTDDKESSFILEEESTPNRRLVMCSNYKDGEIEQLLHNVLTRPADQEERDPQASSSPNLNDASSLEEEEEEDDPSLWGDLDESLLLHGTQLAQDIEKNPEKYYKVAKPPENSRAPTRVSHSTPLREVTKRIRAETNINAPSTSKNNNSLEDLLNDDSLDILISSMPEPQLMTPIKCPGPIVFNRNSNQLTPVLAHPKLLKRTVPLKYKFNIDSVSKDPSPPPKKQACVTNAEEDFFKDDDDEWAKICPEMDKMINLFESQNNNKELHLPCTTKEIDQKRKAALEKRKKKATQKFNR